MSEWIEFILQANGSGLLRQKHRTYHSPHVTINCQYVTVLTEHLWQLQWIKTQWFWFRATCWQLQHYLSNVTIELGIEQIVGQFLSLFLWQLLHSVTPETSRIQHLWYTYEHTSMIYATLLTFEQIHKNADATLFKKIFNSVHCLHHLLPPVKSFPMQLRPGRHNKLWIAIMQMHYF